MAPLFAGINPRAKASTFEPERSPSPPSKDPLDPTPRQFPMPFLWDRPIGPYLLPCQPWGCGIDHEDNDEGNEHETCLRERAEKVKSGSVGPSRLHDALDLATRTSRSRKKAGITTRLAGKRVRFVLDSARSILGQSNISFLATDEKYKRHVWREVDYFAYYCAEQDCGCRVDKFFQSGNKHDEYVLERVAAGDGYSSGEGSPECEVEYEQDGYEWGNYERVGKYGEGEDYEQKGMGENHGDKQNGQEAPVRRSDMKRGAERDAQHPCMQRPARKRGRTH